MIDGGRTDGTQRDPERRGDEVRKGGLAQARWSAEQDVIQGFPATTSGFDKDLQVVHDLALADVLIKAARAERGIEGILVSSAARVKFSGAARRPAVIGWTHSS